MKILFQAISILILTTWPASRAAAQERRHNLMPAPAEVHFQPGKLAVGASFLAPVRGHNDRRLEAGSDRAMRRLEGRIGMELRRGLATDAGAATLVIEPFDKLTKKDRAALAEEGERLVRFVEPKAKSFDARFTV